MSRAFALCLAFSLLSCQTEPTEKKESAAPSQGVSALAPPRTLTKAEFRALSEQATPDARATLIRLLGGSEFERTWAAFALGLACSESRHPDIEHGLVSAVARWASESPPPDPELLRTAGWALGACATPTAEEILRSWLSPEAGVSVDGLLSAGVFGLGAVADRTSDLQERTQTALLDAASRSGHAEWLQPLGRVTRLSEAVGAHILEVAGALLTEESTEGRRHAILALGSAGPSAAAPLGQILLQDKYAPEQRAAAALALGRLGEAGQSALDKTIANILSRGLPISFDRPLWIPLRAALDALERPDASRAGLIELGELVLPEGNERPKQAQHRRLVWLRCRASDLVAGDRENDRALRACDPAHGREQKLALLRVLGRGALKRQRLKTFQELAADQDPVVAQAALRMLPAHPEVSEAKALLSAALQAKVHGTVATACQVIAAHPSRILGEDKNGAPDEKLLSSLAALLSKTDTLPLETGIAVVGAAGAVGALSLKAEVEKLCEADSPALRVAAGQALGLLGDENKKCKPETDPLSSVSLTGPGAPVPVSAVALSPVVTLDIDSDVGRLSLVLDTQSAPATSARFLSLVNEGYFNGTSIFGGRPGFATQFGDRDGDGYEDKRLDSLPSEVSPSPFLALSFGMSEFVPGAGSSQLFVLLADAPQLTGARVHLGKAEGPWHLLVPGDVLHTVTRR